MWWLIGGLVVVAIIVIAAGVSSGDSRNSLDVVDDISDVIGDILDHHDH